MSYPQPTVSPSELRPSRAWYWVAGVIALLGLCIGPGLAVVGFSSFAGILPDFEQEFDADSPTTVRLTADKTWGLFVDDPSTGPDFDRSATDCEGQAEDGGEIDLTRATVDFNFERDGRNWHLVYEVDVTQDGEYEIVCRPTDTSVTDARYAIGESVNVWVVVGTALGSVGALLGIPCLAILVAGIIVLVTAVRRNSHKKRLLQERGGGQPGYPGTPPPTPGMATQPPPAPGGYQTPPAAPPPGPGGYQPPPAAPPPGPGAYPSPGPTPPGAAPPGPTPGSAPESPPQEPPSERPQHEPPQHEPPPRSEEEPPPERR